MPPSKSAKSAMNPKDALGWFISILFRWSHMEERTPLSRTPKLGGRLTRRLTLKFGKPSFAWPVFHPHIIEPSSGAVKRVAGLKRRPGFRSPASVPMTAAASPESAGVRPGRGNRWT
jgi:hypothetical protein